MRSYETSYPDLRGTVVPLSPSRQMLWGRTLKQTFPAFFHILSNPSFIVILVFNTI
jgi:hypothetical protein